jgi:hypothetical protein
MGLNVSGKGGADFELVPAGLYVARCYRVLDLGTQTTNGMYGEKKQHQIMISWELLDDEVKMSDGRPYSVHKTYTASLHEKAKLRTDLEAWRNVRFTDKELEGFDISKIAGTYCQVQVTHSDDGKYANVQAIVSYKPQRDKEGNKVYPEAVNDTLVFDIDNPDSAVLDALSDNMKAKIMGAPEWEAGKKQPSDEPVGESETEPSYDDPFAGEEMPEDFLQYDGQDTVIEPTDAEMQGQHELPDPETVGAKKKAAK